VEWAYEYQLPAERRVHLPRAACRHRLQRFGRAVFSVTGTNGSAASFSWLVNKNDGQGFAVLQTNASVNIIANQYTSFPRPFQPFPGHERILYEAAVTAIGFSTPPWLSRDIAGIIHVKRNVAGGTHDGTSCGQRLYQFAVRLYSAPPAPNSGWRRGPISPTVDAVNRRSFR